jgi:hypothetical protein
VQALFRKVKQRFQTNKEKLVLVKSKRSIKLRVKMQLVVATRLQAQHPPFQLCTLSNTPFVLMNVAHESFC